LTPASLLQPKQELVGTVTRIVPYGVFVDVGANRRGLLHIQKVADLYGHYIDKEQGLEEAGLERGARIRVAVLSNEKK
jgi:predicted RNA-binding protein with RPS1 domain